MGCIFALDIDHSVEVFDAGDEIRLGCSEEQEGHLRFIVHRAQGFRAGLEDG